MHPRQQIAALRHVLSVLASPAYDQIQHLRELRAWPQVDRLAGDWSDAPALLEEPVRQTHLTLAQRQLIGAIERRLKDMGPNRLLWTETSLLEDREWSQIRTLAAETLDLFNS